MNIKNGSGLKTPQVELLEEREPSKKVADQRKCNEKHSRNESQQSGKKETVEEKKKTGK